MYFAKERAQVISRQLRQLSEVQKEVLSDWQKKDGLYFRPEQADQAEQPWEAFDSKKDHWYGSDRHYWFRTSWTVSPEFAGKPLWLRLRTQIDHWDDGKNPQFLLFLNGQVVQGLDMNHQECQISTCAKEGDVYHIDLQAYSGTLFPEFLLEGQMLVIDPDIRGLFYDIQTPLWALDRMQENTQPRLEIEHLINEAVNLVDLREEGSPAFLESVKKAREFLARTLYGEKAGYKDVIATCIGHTHIDVAWQWTVAQTREKTARSFSTVLKLMEEYPEYKFMSSQPQLYQFLKEDYPELYAKIKERVKEGRWEPEGGMWLEADCNLTSGESLARQFLYGKRFFREEFGVDCKELWLPDVFGYSGALPQIMKKSGVNYFMTTKLAWNQFNRAPFDTFMWKGIDGSEILTHFISTVGIGQDPKKSFFTTYNGMLHPDAIMGGWERYHNKDINNDILICYGFGDGGGGPTRKMLETGRRMEKGIPGVPMVQQGYSRDYFERLEKKVGGDPRLPGWEGELYFEYHRGTYTSMGRNKRSNRKSELMLMDLELLAVLAAKKAALSYPAEELERLWKVVLLNQFHDILPGSSIREVYEVTKKEYEEVAQTGQAMLAERLRALTGEENTTSVTLFNTLGFQRDGLVHLPVSTAKSMTLADGTQVPLQKTQDMDGKESLTGYIPTVASKGMVGAKLSELDASSGASPFHIADREIETPFYRVAFDDSGAFTSLFDKENQRQVLQSGQPGNRLRVYEDKPMNYDCWDIDIYYTEKSWPVDAGCTTRLEWQEKGPVRAVLLVEHTFSKSTIRQKICFYANSRRIDFQTVVDWKQHQHLLKVHFPIDVHTDEATFEIQFGNVTRKVHKNTSWDVARFESCAHRWMDMSEGDYGVSLLNDCKYGHSVDKGVMALTLIKSGIEPNPTADQEIHVFTYALLPHAGNWKQAGTAREAASLNQPLYVCMGGNDGVQDSFCSLDRASDTHVMLDTIKQAEDGNGLILRLYEYQNSRGPVTIHFKDTVKSASLCNLIEDPDSSGAVTCDSHSVTLNILPYEIQSVRVILE